MNKTVNIDEVANYLITQGIEAENGFSVLKLQKLLYYVQAWHLALYGKPLFDEKFQAWVHGPVNRTIYRRFRDRSMYCLLQETDLPKDRDTKLTPQEKSHIDNVLEIYGGLSDTQLENLTHNETPWIKARGSLPPLARCETAIEDKDMIQYYRSLMKK